MRSTPARRLLLRILVGPSFVRSISLAAACLAIACGSHASENVGTDDSALLAQDGSDASEVETQSSSLTAAFTLGSSMTATATPDTMVGDADRAAVYFAPSGCMTVTKDTVDHKVTYALDACSGPWGLFRVSGTIVATYSRPSGGAIQIDVDGTGLHLYRATADYHATATITANGLDRTMTWSGHLTGVTARGRAFERDASWTVAWKIGDSCVSIKGSAQGTVLKRSIATTVDDYERCRDQCPTSGTISVTDGATRESVTITFNGSNQATLATSASKTTTEIALACGL